MGNLRKGGQLLFNFLKTKLVNDLVTKAELVAVTGWKLDGTLRTYLSKNKLSRFLYLEGEVFRVLRDGRELTEDEFHSEFTQVNPEQLVLRKSQAFMGIKGSYILEHHKGSGATAQVWRAVLDSTPVAVKVHDPRFDLLRPSVLSNVRARFEREAKKGATLSHDAIVRVIDTGTYSGRPFLVMEYADASVGQLHKRNALAKGDIWDVIAATVSALQYLHSLELVHRDVKPDNILKTERGFVLGDLGIVRWTDFNQDSIRAGTITRASVQLGSWYYMAPEQRASPHDAGFASDIYALGVMWYELLTGDAPAPEWFAAKQIPEVPGMKEVTEMILSMTSFRPEARPSLPEIAAFLEGNRGHGEMKAQ